MLFCDVRDFTGVRRQARAPKEVVAGLNELFEVVVPIVARHGGHVDKFVGDGLLAVFGAPESLPRPRRPRGARRLRDRDQGQLGTRPASCGSGSGVNTGRVVAGSIGGAGRLNFSVIGDAGQRRGPGRGGDPRASTTTS